MWWVFVVLNTYAKFQEKQSSLFFRAISSEKALNSSNIAVLSLFGADNPRKLCASYVSAANHENFQTKLPTRFIELNVSTLFFSVQKDWALKEEGVGIFGQFLVRSVCGLGDFCGLRVFSNLSLVFGFCKNDGGFSDSTVRCILRFFWFCLYEVIPCIRAKTQFRRRAPAVPN